MEVSPGGLWVSLRVSGCPGGAWGAPKGGLRVPPRGLGMSPRRSLGVPRGLRRLVGSSHPPHVASRSAGEQEGVGGAQETFWGCQGMFGGCQGTFWGYHCPPVPPHLDVGLRQGDHLGQDVGHLQVLQLVPLPCALPGPRRGRGDSGGSPWAPQAPQGGDTHVVQDVDAVGALRGLPVVHDVGEGGSGGFARRLLPGPVGAGAGLVLCLLPLFRLSSPRGTPPRRPQPGHTGRARSHGDGLSLASRGSHLQPGFAPRDPKWRGWARSYFPW